MTITIKQCPRCQKVATSTKEIQELFGFRTMKPGKEPVPQSHCRDCRSGESAAKKEEERLAKAAQAEAIAKAKASIPAPVIMGSGPAPDKIVAVPYRGVGKGHKEGEIVFLGTHKVLYKITGGGSITAL